MGEGSGEAGVVHVADTGWLEGGASLSRSKDSSLATLSGEATLYIATQGNPMHGTVSVGTVTLAHCSTLQHTAAHCNTLQHTAMRCDTLQHMTTVTAGTGGAPAKVESDVSVRSPTFLSYFAAAKRAAHTTSDSSTSFPDKGDGGAKKIADANANASTNANANANTNAKANANVNANANSNANANAADDVSVTAHVETRNNVTTYGVANKIAHANANTNANTNVYANAAHDASATAHVETRNSVTAYGVRTCESLTETNDRGLAMAKRGAHQTSVYNTLQHTAAHCNTLQHMTTAAAKRAAQHTSVSSFPEKEDESATANGDTSAGSSTTASAKANAGEGGVGAVGGGVVGAAIRNLDSSWEALKLSFSPSKATQRGCGTGHIDDDHSLTDSHELKVCSVTVQRVVVCCNVSRTQ